MKLPALALGGLLAAVSAPALHAGCCAHHDAEAAQAAAPAIGEYRINSREVVTDAKGQIVTRYTAQLNDELKGEAPARLEFSTPGGRRGNITVFSSLGLDLEEGSDHIIHLRKDAAGQWEPVPFATRANRGTTAEKKALRKYFREGARGRMPVAKSARPVVQVSDNSGLPSSKVTATGYLEPEGYPGRFTACDGGMPIPYIVDIDDSKLPAGMTRQDALDAVAEALGSWSAASTLKFKFAGEQTFGQNPELIQSHDRTLRVQLHDTYNRVAAPATGVGGCTLTNNPGIREGGRVGSQEFQEILSGWLVLEHDTPFMDNIANFKHVLTHELGHALGLAHSSTDPDEPDPILKNATMYQTASDDGRGVGLTDYDKDRIAFGYPVTNTPPYLPDRIINAVADNSTANGDLPPLAGVNSVLVRGFDLQGDVQTATGLYSPQPTRWALTGNVLTHIPLNANTAFKTDAEIASGDFHYWAYVQVGDGVNLSRAARVGVIKITQDSRPTDALPAAWMTTHFQNSFPAPEPDENNPIQPRHPLADPDGDGLNNWKEYTLGTSPIDPGSPANWLSYDPVQSKLNFTPMRFVAYEIQESPDMVNWTTISVQSTYDVPQTITLDATPPSLETKQKFYRAIPIP